MRFPQVVLVLPAVVLATLADASNVSMGICPEDPSLECTSCDENYFGPRCNINPCLVKKCNSLTFNSTKTDGCHAWNATYAECVCPKGEDPDLPAVYVFDFVGILGTLAFLMFWIRRRVRSDDFREQWVLPKYIGAHSPSASIPPIVVLGWRMLALSFYLITIILDFANPEADHRWSAYLTITYQSFTTQCVYYGLGVAVCISYLRNTSGTMREKLFNSSLGAPERLSLVERAHLLVGGTVLPITIFVLLVYWLLLYPQQQNKVVSYNNAARHAINCPLSIVEFLIGYAIHVNWRHFPYILWPVIFFWTYSTISELAGLCPVYFVTYANTYMTIPFLIGLYLVLLGHFFLWFGISKLKQRFYMREYRDPNNTDVAMGSVVQKTDSSCEILTNIAEGETTSVSSETASVVENEKESDGDQQEQANSASNDVESTNDQTEATQNEADGSEEEVEL